MSDLELEQDTPIKSEEELEKKIFNYLSQHSLREIAEYFNFLYSIIRQKDEEIESLKMKNILSIFSSQITSEKIQKQMDFLEEIE
ncbi:MAG: hypothetical protein ACTSYI_08810 [Promethearchaeota archaeon]